MNKLILLIGLLLIINGVNAALNFTTIQLNATCYSSEPNVETGDIGSGKAVDGFSNITDRNPDTFVYYYSGSNANVSYIDLVSQYTITDVRINATSYAGTAMITISGSPDNSTYTPIVVVTFSGIGLGQFQNISVAPLKNVRYVKIQKTGGTGTNVTISEVEVYGHPELCHRENMKFFGDLVNWRIAYREISYNNSGNYRSLIYQDPSIGRVSITDQMNITLGLVGYYGFAMLPQLINNQVYFQLPGGQSVSQNPIFKLDLSTQLVSVWTRPSSINLADFSLATNNTLLFSYGSLLGGTTQRIQVIRINDGAILNTSTVSGAALDAIGNVVYNSTSKGFDSYGQVNNVIWKMQMDSAYKYSESNFAPSTQNASVPLVFWNGTKYKVIYTTTDDGNSEFYISEIDGTLSPKRITTTAYDEIVSASTNGLSQGSNGDIFVLYQNGSGGNLIIGVMCGNSTSPTLGQSCTCANGTAFDGASCSFPADNITLNVFDQDTNESIWFNATFDFITQTYLVPNSFGNFSVNASEVPDGNARITAYNSSYYDASIFAAVTDIQQNYSIGMLSKSNPYAHQVTFNVINNVGVSLSDAFVLAQRVYGGSYVNVSSCNTDSSGSCAMYMDSRVQYQVIVSKAGYDSVTTQITPTQNLYTITLSIGSSGAYSSSSYGITQYLTPDYLNVCQNWTIINYTVYDTSNQLVLYGLNVTLFNGTILSSQSFTNNNGGVVSFNLSTIDKEFNVTVVGFYQKSGSSLSNYTKIYLISNCTLQSWSLEDVARNVRNSGGGLSLTIIALFLVMLTVAWAVRFTPVAIGGGIVAIVAIFIIFQFVYDMAAIGAIMLGLFITAVALVKLRSGR